MKKKLEAKRIPIGLLPKEIWEGNCRIKRLNQLREAIARYYDAGLKIDIKWIEEYNELIEFIGD